MTVAPGKNRTRTLTNGIGGLDSETYNPFSPLEFGWTVDSNGTTSLEIAAGSAVATGSCSLAATPGCS